MNNNGGQNQSIKALNASNEKKRLEEKVRAYNNSVRNNSSFNSSSNPSMNPKKNFVSPKPNSEKENQNVNGNTNNNSGKNSKSQHSSVVNTAAKTGLKAAGVPSAVSDKVVDSEIGQKVMDGIMKKNAPLAFLDKMFGGSGGEKKEESKPEENNVTIELSSKLIKIGMFLIPCISLMMIFLLPILLGSYVFLKAVGLGSADSLSQQDAENKVNKKIDSGDDLNTPIEDEEVGFEFVIDDEKIFSFKQHKLKESNLVKTSSASTKYLKRKYNEADLDKLEDYFPQVTDASKNYDENMVYDFFFKMYNLYISYRDNYNVYLDLPLLMATLSIQSDDMNVVFSSNMSELDRKNTARKLPIDEFDYYFDWTGYITTKTSSTHDMEVLAQNMVSVKSSDECDEPVDGKCYVIDDEKYREFLKEFIEKKYYLSSEPLDGGYAENDENESNNNSGSSETPNKPAVEASGSYRQWRQCGQSWSNLIVPKSNDSMCQIGCLITSVTIQMARSGTGTVVTPINPGVALKYYSFVDGGYFIWGSTTNLAPSFKYSTEISLIGLSRDSIVEKLNSYDPNKYYIVLAVGRLSESAVSHYVALDYADANSKELYMIDPVSDSNLVYSLYKVYSAHVYVKED